MPVGSTRRECDLYIRTNRKRRRKRRKKERESDIGENLGGARATAACVLGRVRVSTELSACSYGTRDTFHPAIDPRGQACELARASLPIVRPSILSGELESFDGKTRFSLFV